MSSRKSLKINARQYKILLGTSSKHKYYIGAFNTTRKQRENITDLNEVPSLDDFSSHSVKKDILIPFLISSPYLHYTDEDEYTKLVTKKRAYQQTLNLFSTFYEKDKKKIKKNHVKAEGSLPLPKYVVHLGQGKLRDPDSYFSGDYNWYYTGGVLDSYVYNGIRHNVCPISNGIGMFNEKNSDVLDVLKCNNDLPIYNLKINGSTMTVRQRNFLSLIDLNKQNIMWDEMSEVPYIDVTYDGGNISAVTMDHKLKVTDLSCERVVFEHEFKTLGKVNDMLGLIGNLDTHNSIFMDRNSLRILDSRSRDETFYRKQNEFFVCDELCVVSPSQANDNYLFLASTHNIMKMDLRKMNVVKSWSHMLSLPPLMMKTGLFDDEVIFLSTSNYSDRVILYSNSSEDNLIQVVPNIIDTLMKYNLEYNFDIYNEMMKKRLKFSTVGIDITAEMKNAFSLLTCNSVGDVFKNKIPKLGHGSNIKSLKRFHKWASAVNKDPRPLEVTSLQEMSDAKRVFSKSTRTKALQIYTRNNSKTCYLFRTKTDDIEMASIWDEYTSEGNGLSENVLSINKVNTWLEMADMSFDRPEFVDVTYM